MDEGGLACLVCLVAFHFSFGGNGEADLGEDRRDVGRSVVGGSGGVANGDADELDASPRSSEGGEDGVILLGILDEFLLAAEVPIKADLEENEGAILAVEGVGVRSGVGWHSSGINDVRGGTRSCRH